MKKNLFILQLALISLFTLNGCTGAAQPSNGVQNIKPAEFTKIAGEKNTVIIDVRTPGEVAQGYIKGATVFANINGSDFEAQINKLDKSKKYLVYCRSGARSSSAANYMAGKGFTKVYNLSGGINNWTGETIIP